VISVLLTLFVVLSPICVPLTVSYMTDITALCLFLVALYAALRATDAPSSGGSGRWLALCTLAGAVGATVRQPVALLPLVAIPCVLRLRHARGRDIAVGAALWGIATVAMWATNRWFGEQPYAIVDRTQGALPILSKAVRNGQLLRGIVSGVLTPFLLVLPLTLFTVPAIWFERARSRRERYPLALPLLAVILCTLAIFRLKGAWWPYWDDLFTYHDFWIMDYNGESGGMPPTILPRAVRFVLLLGVFLTLLLSVGLSLRRSAASRSAPAPIAITILSGFAGIYLFLILARSPLPFSFLLDRYWLPLLPLLGLLALQVYHRTFGDDARIPRGAWCGVALYGLYTIAATHDHLFIARARLAAANQLTHAGIERSALCVSFPYDVWTQYEASGYLNDPRLTTPPDAYRPFRVPPEVQALCWYAERTPAVQPKYFILLHPNTALADTAFPARLVSTWLPPYDRRVLIQQRRP